MPIRSIFKDTEPRAVNCPANVFSTRSYFKPRFLEIHFCDFFYICGRDGKKTV